MPLKTILIEDSQTIRENLIPTLSELANARVIAIAEGAGEAIEALVVHEQEWDLAIVDLFLKEGSGLSVLRAARNRSPHQHILVLTNYPTAEIRRRCLALGADGVFDKSTELEAFFDLCRSYGG
ncbi:response regulator transcription factor [Variovorax sp. J22P240]|uniref:response regulator n=1 Tax=Variovorax sp. J22P240 TaxID=3053514 RepID=UPI0025750D1C|nr:response regulator transcription factor [Variovorax sp. J22P240]MDM0002957.1 response regulator transcription factor [Variovorax sp. J22P240]